MSKEKHEFDYDGENYMVIDLTPKSGYISPLECGTSLHSLREYKSTLKKNECAGKRDIVRVKVKDERLWYKMINQLFAVMTSEIPLLINEGKLQLLNGSLENVEVSL